MNSMVKAAIVGAISALAVDLQAFVQARTQNPDAKFDFVLAGARMALGAVTGLVAGETIGG